MVNAAATLGRSGSHDFILIRASALVMAAYAIFLVAWLACNPGVDYAGWVALYSGLGMKVFTLLTLTGLLMHGWIGIWQVLTDYVKCSRLRVLLQYIVVLALGVYWFTGLFVLWGV
ncbi:succinate dehydrogenase, hydrophobic membrane anchor protein [Aliidiomarina taiwanensis]|uniref:Succinate dehydrogenase hydrophobic membrane anchor subunit n=1 Tax=Aliidiomarina taiwanensis TaxID=946228 RepID=A0A432X980_9GAMM|nr:succinate dehydrogenase, hydrophobic membrane anchor protein [Aliidiomarina taiwanensis]RUO43973.1 succinate dehydrogenase, hydrophobic membrane anchor protein [Aliidiomarina taiwanensis]